MGLGDVEEAFAEVVDFVDSRRAGAFDRSRLAGEDAVDGLLGEDDSSSEIFPPVLRLAAGVRVVDFFRGAGVRVGVLDRPRGVLAVDFGVLVDAVFLLVADFVTDLGVEVAGVDVPPGRALGLPGVLAMIYLMSDVIKINWTEWNTKLR